MAAGLQAAARALKSAPAPSSWPGAALAPSRTLASRRDSEAPGAPPAACTATWPRLHESGKGTAGGDRDRRPGATARRSLTSRVAADERLLADGGGLGGVLRRRLGRGGRGGHGLSDCEGRLQMGPRHLERGCGAHTRKHTHRHCTHIDRHIKTQQTPQTHITYRHATHSTHKCRHRTTCTHHTHTDFHTHTYTIDTTHA